MKMSLLKQTEESNRKRSESYKKTASEKKKTGHALEDIFADARGGNLIPAGQKSITGQKRKTDVEDPQYGNCSVKKREMKHIQALLESTDVMKKRLKVGHPLTDYSIASRDYYHDKHEKQGLNSNSLREVRNQKAMALKQWLEDKNNQRQMFEYIFGGNNDIDHMSIISERDPVRVTMIPFHDFINGIVDLNLESHVTDGGRVVLRKFKGFTNKGKRQTQGVFTLEQRSNKGHYNGHLYKAEAKRIWEVIDNSDKSFVVDL
jgi:hypothetical protein